MAVRPQLPIRVALETRHRWFRIKNVYGYDASGEIRYLVEKHLRNLERRLEKENPGLREKVMNDARGNGSD
jgi:hypothetical protein